MQGSFLTGTTESRFSLSAPCDLPIPHKPRYAVEIIRRYRYGDSARSCLKMNRWSAVPCHLIRRVGGQGSSLLLKVTDWLVMFATPDCDGHIAMVAETTEKERKIIGVVRLILDLILTQEKLRPWSRQVSEESLGQKLMQRVIEIARRKGLDEIHGGVRLRITGKCSGSAESSDSQQNAPGGITRITLQLK